MTTPGFWTIHVSPESGKVFKFNPHLNESRWLTAQELALYHASQQQMATTAAQSTAAAGSAAAGAGGGAAIISGSDRAEAKRKIIAAAAEEAATQQRAAKQRRQMGMGAIFGEAAGPAQQRPRHRAAPASRAPKSNSAAGTSYERAMAELAGGRVGGDSGSMGRYYVK